jgi:hypothetical protein
LVGKTFAGLDAHLRQEGRAGEWTWDLVCAEPDGPGAEDKALAEFLPQTGRIHRLASVAAEGSVGEERRWDAVRSLRNAALGGKGKWIEAAVSRGLEIIKAREPELIYSRSHPPASHLAALKLARQTRLPWVAHFSDPWSGHAYYRNPFVRMALRHWEKKIFRAATKLVFVSEALREAMLAEESASVRAKAEVIPHFFVENYGAPPNRIRTEDLKDAPTPGVVAAHIGDFYGLRSPLPLVTAWKQLHAENPESAKKLMFWQVGRVEDKFMECLNSLEAMGVLHRLPSVAYGESLALASSADLLIVVEAPAPAERAGVFFPSKIVDYLAVGKPLLAVSSRGSVSAGLAQEWDQGWCEPEDVKALTKYLAFVATGKLWSPPPRSARERFGAKANVKELLRVWREARAHS